MLLVTPLFTDRIMLRDAFAVLRRIHALTHTRMVWINDVAFADGALGRAVEANWIFRRFLKQHDQGN